MKKRLLLTTLLVTAALGIAACGKTQSGEDNLNKATVINIAYSETNPIGKAIDEAKGFSEEIFKDTGIKVNWTSGLGTGSETIASLVGGSVDIANLGEFPVITSYGNDKQEFKIIAYNRSVGGGRIIASADSGIKTVADLKGKKVGTAVGTGSQLYLLQELEAAGLTVDDIELVNLGNGAWAAAFEAGEIDAESSSTTSTDKFVNNGSAVELAKSGAELNLIIGSNEFITKNPDIAAKVVSLYQKIFAYVTENPAEAAEIVAAQSGQDPAAITAQFQRLVNKTFQAFEQEDYDRLQAVKEFALSLELIANDFDVKTVTDFTYLEKANK